MTKGIITWLATFLLINSCYGQKAKTIIVRQQTWLGWVNQTRISNKWAIGMDVNHRTLDNFVQGSFQNVFRLGVTYITKGDVRLSSGYAFVIHHPAEGHPTAIRKEHRPWQQIQWNTTFPKSVVRQSLRLEERFRQKILKDSTLGSGYNFNYKVRYNLLWERPFSSSVKNRYYFFINNDVHINFGQQIVFNYFDQNRIYIGLKLKTHELNQLQVGYMNLFQQLSAGNRYRQTHVIRINYLQHIDLRKKK